MTTAHDPDTDWKTQVDSQLADLSVRQERMEQQIQLNTDATFEIHDILSAAKGAFRVLGWVGSFASWAVKIGAAGVAMYAAAKTAFPHLFKG